MIHKSYDHQNSKYKHMKKTLLLLSALLFLSIATANALDKKPTEHINQESPGDSIRLAELDRYWAKVSQTVKEGDFEGYSALYHKDAVVIFATGKNKISNSIEVALANWKQGFIDTKAGKKQDNVEFRFSQRIGSETTAHESGIFYFTSFESGKEEIKELVHFEMLLVRGKDGWYSLMEYQKSKASQEEWDALK